MGARQRGHCFGGGEGAPSAPPRLQNSDPPPCPSAADAVALVAPTQTRAQSWQIQCRQPSMKPTSAGARQFRHITHWASRPPPSPPPAAIPPPDPPVPPPRAELFWEGDSPRPSVSGGKRQGRRSGESGDSSSRDWYTVSNYLYSLVAT